MSVEMGDILFLSPTTRHEGGIIVPRKEDVMKNLRFARKWVLIALSGTFLAMGLATLMQGEAQAGPDCGPTLNWNCVRPRCPECPEFSFTGTVCEKNAFELRTHTVCSPE